MRTTVTFDGVDLTALGFVGEYRAPLLPREIYREQVAGRDGDVFLGARYSAKTITLRLTVRAQDPAERQRAVRVLAAVLAVDEPKPLVLSIDGGLYHRAIPTSNGDGTRYLNHTSFDVDFEVLDPAAYGETRTVTVPSGGSVTFEVGGTYQTMPIVVATQAKNDASAGRWKLILDGGDYLIANVASAARLEADCYARTLKVAGATRVLELDGDWLVLTPGTHELVMTGTGAATVTYPERWI